MNSRRCQVLWLPMLAALVACGPTVTVIGGDTSTSTSDPQNPDDPNPPSPDDPDPQIPDVKPPVLSCDGVDLQTSPDHCGSCGHSCKGGECAAGECQEFVIAQADRSAFRIQATAEGLAWLTWSSVVETDLSSEPRTIWEIPHGDQWQTPSAFAVGDSYIAVALTSGDVWRVGRDGTGALRVASGQHPVRSIRARGDEFYWATIGTPVLMRLDVSGEVETLSTDPCSANDLVLSGARAIVLSPDCGAFTWTPLTGGASQILAQDVDHWSPIFGAERDGAVAWISDAEKGGLYLTEAANGATRLIHEFGQRPIMGQHTPVNGTAVAIDRESVYFATSSEELDASQAEVGYLYAMKQAGGVPVRISTVPATIHSIAVRDDLVAWTHRDLDESTIRARAK